MGIPGGFFQGEDEGTTIALQLGRDPGNTQLRSLGDRSFAHEIEVTLDPIVIKVGDLPDFQMNLADLFGLMAEGKIKSNFQDILSDRQLMHLSGQGHRDFYQALKRMIAGKVKIGNLESSYFNSFHRSGFPLVDVFYGNRS